MPAIGAPALEVWLEIPQGLLGGGDVWKEGSSRVRSRKDPLTRAALHEPPLGLFLLCLRNSTVLYPTGVQGGCSNLGMKLFPSTNISKPGLNVALWEKKNLIRGVMKSFSLVLLASKMSCWCGTGMGRAYPFPLGPCSGWALPQPPDLGGLSQPARTAPLQGCPQGTHSRSP